MIEKTVMMAVEQGRAEFAYRKAQEGCNLGEKKNEYKAYVKRIPMLIQTNGIGATFAFVKAKATKNTAYELIYNQTTEWLRKDSKGLIQIGEGDDLVEKIVALNSFEYRVITTEIMALFTWLRRFAEGLIIEKDVEAYE